MEIYERLEAPRSPKQVALFGEALAWAFQRITDMDRSGDITGLEVQNGFVKVSHTYTSWNRCGDSSTEETHYEIPLKIFFSDTNLCAWANQQDQAAIDAAKRKEEEERRRKEADVAAWKLRREETRRERDLAELARLKAEYESN